MSENNYVLKKEKITKLLVNLYKLYGILLMMGNGKFSTVSF